MSDPESTKPPTRRRQSSGDTWAARTPPGLRPQADASRLRPCHAGREPGDSVLSRMPETPGQGNVLVDPDGAEAIRNSTRPGSLFAANAAAASEDGGARVD